MSLQAPSFLANGNILPATFVKLDPSATHNFMVLQAAAATDKIVGISDDGTYQPPGITGSDGYAAHQGQPVKVYGDGDQCLLQIDSGADVTAGDWLKSGATGGGITIAFTLGAGTIFSGAQTLETANASEFARVIVRIQALTECTA